MIARNGTGGNLKKKSKNRRTKMANKNETLADIVAECRRDYCDMNTRRQYMPTPEYLRILLDRLEAAWKRQEQCYLDQIRDAVNMIGHERSAKEHPPVGNAAAMREALVKCREIALQWQADEAAGVAGTTDKPSARSAAEAVIDMEFEINAALSAPARNCDRFAYYFEAVNYWHENVECADVNGCFDVWLFESAQLKGEGDEQK